MGLQFVFGGSGSGKSCRVYEKIINQSLQHPDKNYFIMVPDQFTMYTQSEICNMHPNGGIMNIDVLSFSRLIYRVADEVGQKDLAVLDDTGKNLVLRRVAAMEEDKLTLLRAKLRRPGYIHEVKSMLSEFYQYDISPETLLEMIEMAKEKGQLKAKLSDLHILYQGFQKYIADKFITTEESLSQLCQNIPKSNLLKGSVIVFDGFTGFTPIQVRVLEQLMQVCDEVIVTLCADGVADLSMPQEDKLFALSEKTYRVLSRCARDLGITVRENLYLDSDKECRYENKQALQFLERNIFRFGDQVYGDKPEAISIYEADHLTDEVQKVCMEIRQLLHKEGYCYRDIAVVTGDLSRYAHLLQREFQRYGIPFFLDQNRGIVFQPLTAYVTGALSILKDNFSFDSVFGFLHTGMSTLSQDEVDRLQNYVLRYKIRGRSKYEKEFTLGDEETLELVNPIREKFLLELAPILEKMKTAKDFSMQLLRLCQNADLQNKCLDLSEKFAQQEELSRAKEYEKIYPAIMDLLNQIYELIGEDEMDVKEYLEILEAGISEIEIGTIPQSLDQVLLGDIERSRLSKVKALFFIGVNDGVIPGNGGSGGLLSDLEREFLCSLGRELAPTPRQKIFQQRLYLYQNMTKPTEKLYLSYSKLSGEGKALFPSYLIGMVKDLYPAMKVGSSDTQESVLARIMTPEDGLDDLAHLFADYVENKGEKDMVSGGQLCALYHAYDNDEYDKQLSLLAGAAFVEYQPTLLPKDLVTSIYGERAEGSISRMELFAGCGYAHFLKYGLHLLEQSEYDFQATDLGSVYHEVLEEFLKQVAQEDRTLADLSEEEILEKLLQILEETIDNYGEKVLQSSARNQYRVKQMERVLTRSLHTMQHHQKKGSFVPMYFERSFALYEGMKIVGKIDRIDVSHQDEQTYVKVVDYKSGTPKFDLDKLYYGLSLQLPLYLYAAVELLKKQYPKEKITPASMLYYKMQNPLIGADKVSELVPELVEDKIYKEMRLEGLTSDDLSVLLQIDKDFSKESDVIKVSQKKDGSFGKGAQVASTKDMQLFMDYAHHKICDLMSKMYQGDIAIRPLQLEGDSLDSCSYCPYRSVCKLDMKVPGFQKRIAPKLEEEKRKEEMEHAIHPGSTEGN